MAIVLKLANTPYQNLMVSVPPLVNLFPTWIFSKMLIGDLSNTPNDDDYNMYINFLPIV
jgi:hypothetical protein